MCNCVFDVQGAPRGVHSSVADTVTPGSIKVNAGHYQSKSVKVSPIQSVVSCQHYLL